MPTDNEILKAKISHQELKITFLEARIAILEDAIRKHRDAQGHEMCWENDLELYQVLKDKIETDHRPPSRCEFRQKCREYYESRPDASKIEDGW